MAYPTLCAKLRKTLARYMRVAYGKDLEAILHSRGSELILIGIDSKNKRYLDICGMQSSDFQIIVDKGFINNDGGFRANAHELLGLSKPTDAFLLNSDYFSVDEKRAVPLIVHELAHFLDQIDEPPSVEANDDENAQEILKSLLPEVLAREHTKRWALHLTSAARVLMIKRLTPFTTVGSFLEAAIPNYDREGPVRARKRW
jgi:hypothetical protein